MEGIYVLLRSLKSKGFLFTVEAGVVLIVIFYLFLNSSSLNAPDLSNELMFMQLQDIVEVCSLKKDYSRECIKQVEEVNPHIKITCVSFTGECSKPVVKRSYVQVTAKLI